MLIPPLFPRLGWVALALGAFLWAATPAIDATFLADDFILLHWSQPRTLEQARSYFSTDWGGEVGRGGYYRPLVNLSLGLDWWLHGNEARGHHLTNVFLHLGAALAFFFLAWRLTSLSSAFVAAVFFLLHPLHDLSVLWLSGRTDLLCALFFFATLALALSPRPGVRLLALPTFALSLLAKEMAVTVPLVLAAYAFAVPSGRRALDRFIDAARASWPFLAVLIAYVAVRVSILGGIGGDSRLLHVGTNMMVGATRLLLWTLIPWDLGPLEGPLTTPWVIGVVSVVVAALFWRLRHAVTLRPELTFALLLLVLSMLPVIGQVASWYVYIPSAGACLLFASLLPRPPVGKVATFVAAAVAAVFAVSLRHNAVKVAEAAGIVDDVLGQLERRQEAAFLVNAPICYAGRLPLLTSKTQYESAFRLRGTTVDVRPLTYAYIGNTRDYVSIVTAEDGVVDTFVSGDLDTFLVLGDTGRLPPKPVEGTTVHGRDARYTVTAMGEDGKVRSLRLLDLDCRGRRTTLEYRPAGLRPVPFRCD